MTEQLASTSASGFFEWFDRVSREARGTPVGEIMLAAGFEVFHAGGGCLAWSKDLADPRGWQILICDEGNGLGNTPDETYLIGLYGADGDQWVTNDTDNLRLRACACCRMAGEAARDHGKGKPTMTRRTDGGDWPEATRHNMAVEGRAAIERTLAVPSVHLNGTSQGELMEHHLDVLSALRHSEKRMALNCPNGRDFYVQKTGAFEAAMHQHQERVERLRSIIAEVEAIAEAISDQGVKP